MAGAQGTPRSLDYPRPVALLRNKQSETPEPVPGLVQGSGDGKGRPTPKRKEAEAANKRPLVPTDRKSAGRDAKSQQREARARQYQAMKAGDERYLPAKDKGPVRRYVRDHVDARWNIAEYFLPIALVFFVVMIVTTGRDPVISFVILAALYLLVLIAVVDAVIMWFGLKKRLRAKFGEVPKGTAFYAVMRAFQLRRSRMPKPAHAKHGVYPE
jgi:hypothetical protein